MDKPWWEDSVCWLCDYGMFPFVFLAVIVVGLLRHQNFLVPTGSTIFPQVTPTYSGQTPIPTVSPVNTSPAAVTATSTPSMRKPEFILVFLPVDWKSSQSIFQNAAQNQADTFARESDVEKYFTLHVVILDSGVENVSLASEDVVNDVLEYALQKQPGDRYVGLTDGDLRPEGDSSVVGWTSGGSAMVAEYTDEYVTSHELGHTFGLCDEYDYTAWSQQNAASAGGCPNPFPKECSQFQNDSGICPGMPADDGSNSIMGPSGLLGDYSYNAPSFSHLQEYFSDLSKGAHQ